MRLRQWIKNLFIFLPLLFGHKLFAWDSVWRTAAGFFIFSIVASAVYLVNHVYHRPEDRKHPIKRDRPIARGDVPAAWALGAAFVLGVAGTSIAFFVRPSFGWTVIVYLTSNVLYSFLLKKARHHRCFLSGRLFCSEDHRGTVLANVPLSHWMLFMVFLLALFLGFNKRRQELVLLEKAGQPGESAHPLRYGQYFIDQSISTLTSSIVVVYMLYTTDAETIKRFGTSHLIWTVPFVYFGIFRYLFIVHQMNEGPTRRA